MRQQIIPKYLIYLFLVGFLTPEVVAQVQVNGTVVAADGLPLPSVNVMILNETDSALVKGAVTDDIGIYRMAGIQPGNYILSISMVGFRTHEEAISIYEPGDENFSIDKITLDESIEQLGEVVTTARRPLYEQEIDRLVVNVQRSVTSSGSTALEVLEKSPGVQVNRQSNDISLTGKSGVIVMINDKNVRLPLESVITMLNGMSAANIEKIELITTPPAKYEAEGNAGIINIQMKEYSDLGYTGSFGTNIGYSSAETLGGNFAFSRRKNKLAFLLNYSINYNNSEESMFSERFFTEDGFTQTIRSENFRDPITTVQNISMGFEYALTEKTDTELLLTGFQRKWDTSDVSESLDHSSPNSLLIMEQSINEKNLWRNGIINFGIDHVFSEDRTLNFDLDYLYYKNSNPSSYRLDVVTGDVSPNNADAINVEKETPINIWVSKLDYQHEVSSKITFETGLKSTYSDFVNDVHVSDRVNGNFIVNNSFTNEADLEEFIGAIYLSSSISPSDKFQINAGIRYEHISRNLNSVTEGSIVDRKTGRLFPSLFIQKSIKNDHKVNLSYSRRTTRPTFWDLAPFVFFIDPKTFLSGNSNLKSAISDGFSLGYSRKSFLATLAYTHSSDEIARWQPSFDTETNNQIYSTQNLEFLDTYSLTSSFPLEPLAWWSLRISATGRYQFYRSAHLEDNFSGEAAGFNSNVVNTLDLPKDFSFEVSGFYQSKSVWGIARSRPQGSLNLGLQKKIGNGQGTLRLTATDILNTNILQANNNIESANINSFWRYNFDARSVTVSFTWNFGSNEFEKIEVSSGSEEEQNRVGIN
ncbi:TonB-dependent receptor family protein [Aliifodinibius salicampi]|uniref:TonB-dependent receptor family protein n=1 Tax=Fodinibius salicampi TaxID=1920655 RepID=A0ABT3PVZ2_9BACT|nr:outer membrane beta-barrel family protein [Fodinibius salicampi]MCW9712031.1 TonB-dependent receptor family protein [Fodinibius salicampi]